MLIVSEFLPGLDDVHKRSIVYLDYKQHRTYPWMYMDVGRDLRGFLVHTHDLLVTNEKQYLAFCALVDIEPADGSSFYQYLEAVYSTYSYH